MKVAVIYSGLIRNFEYNIASHKKNLLNLYDCDVFFYLWDIKGIGMWPNKNLYKEEQSVNDDFKNQIINNLNPKKYFFENYNSKLEYFDSVIKQKSIRFCDTCSPYSLLGQFFTLQKAFSFMQEYMKLNNQNYDLVLRARTDLIYHSEIILKKDTDSNKIYLPHIESDQFAVGSYDAMNIYCHTYDWILNNYNTDNIGDAKTDVPENWLFSNLKHNKIIFNTNDDWKYLLKLNRENI